MFFPKPGSWMESLVNSTPSKVIFVAAEEDPDLIIGSIRGAGGHRYRVRHYDKPLKATTTAKQEPTKYTERYTSKVSSGVWDLRRRHKEREGATD